MSPKQTLRKSDIYLNKLIAFKDTELVKVVTGIRRCGKLSLRRDILLYYNFCFNESTL